MCPKIYHESGNRKKFSREEVNKLAEPRSLPKIEDIEALLKKSSNIDDLLASQRRLAAIYHRIPTFQDLALIQEEITSYTEVVLSVSELQKAFHTKEQIKSAFHAWAHALSSINAELPSLALTVIDDFVDCKWDYRNPVSPILYLLAVRNRLEQRLTQQNTVIAHFDEDESDDKEGEYSLGWFRKDSLSLFWLPSTN